MDLSRKKKSDRDEIIRNDSAEGVNSSPLTYASDDEEAEAQSSLGDIEEDPQVREEIAFMQDCYASDLADSDQNLSNEESIDDETSLVTDLPGTPITDDNGNQVEKNSQEGTLAASPESIALH